MDIESELESLRSANQALRQRLDERRQVDSLRRQLRDGESVDEVAEQSIRYAEAELGGLPCILLHEEIARPGFGLRGVFGLAAERMVPSPDIFVERTPALAPLAEKPLFHSRATPFDPLARIADAMRSDDIAVAGVYENEHLVGLLVAPGGDSIGEQLTVAAEEIGSAIAAATRAQARAEELARRQAQEVELMTLFEEIEKRDKALQAELLEARRFQQQLIALPPLEGVTACSFYEPMGLIGGDLYAISQQGTRVRIFIADATGHGIRASLTTMFIKNGYESYARLADPSLVLAALNDSIASTYRSSEMLFTASCVDLDTESGAVAFACAAHPPACAIRGGELLLLESESAPMGVRRGMKYELVRTTLAKGDGLYLHTDGINEAHVADGRYFGEARLYDIVRRSHVAGEDVGARVREELLDFVGQFSLSDDAALIGVRLE